MAASERKILMPPWCFREARTVSDHQNAQGSRCLQIIDFVCYYLLACLSAIIDWHFLLGFASCLEKFLAIQGEAKE